MCLGLLDCCNKVSQAGWFMKNRNLLLIIQEAQKSKVKVPAQSPSGKGSLHGSQPFHCALTWQNELDSSVGSLISPLIPFMRPQLMNDQDLITFQSPCLLIPSPWRVGTLRYEFRGIQTFRLLQYSCEVFLPQTVNMLDYYLQFL